MSFSPLGEAVATSSFLLQGLISKAEETLKLSLTSCTPPLQREVLAAYSHFQAFCFKAHAAKFSSPTALLVLQLALLIPFH